MFYSDEIIEEVRMKNDIVDVISDYVKLQKKGSSYFGLCPFHNEKSPSFSVCPGKQMYYCFGCGAGGNVFTFLMQYENFTFGEAMETLATRVGIELPKQELDKEFTMNDIVERYKLLIEKNENKKNEQRENIEKIAVYDTFSVSDKVKDIFRELIRKPKFVFNKLFSINEKPKAEVVTAFTGVLELSRRNKINAEQSEIFGDIVITKRKKEN